jgi:hypothetical protein
MTRVPAAGPAVSDDMTRVAIEDHSLTATAALVWSADLPRPPRQLLFETADGVTPPLPASPRTAG